MQRFTIHSHCLAAIACLGDSTAWGQVTNIGPFTGAVSESFESYPNYTVAAFTNPATLLGEAAVLSFPSEMRVYEPLSGATFGQIVFWQDSDVADGLKGLGFMVYPSAREIATLTFATPITDFGGYWRAFTDEAQYMVFNFFNCAGDLAGQESILSQNESPLVWHGWHYAQPIKTVTFDGLMMAADGLQANPVPEPRAWVLLAAAGLALAGWQSRRKSAG